MIDVHCHIDLYKNPFNILNECEAKGIITIGMTNLPSHFELGINHVKNCKRVRLALGLHPLHAEQHHNEIEKFIQNIFRTTYIGEVGLDFSKEGIKTKEIQIESFTKILSVLTDNNKIISLHSRKAEQTVLDLLVKFNIKNAIFHWYSGPLQLIDKIVEAGYYFSVNPAMILSNNGQKIIERIPQNRVLTESDGPFIEHNGRQVRPSDVHVVETYLSKAWGVSKDLANEIIQKNFKSILDKIKSS